MFAIGAQESGTGICEGVLRCLWSEPTPAQGPCEVTSRFSLRKRRGNLSSSTTASRVNYFCRAGEGFLSDEMKMEPAVQTP